ncbi:TfoX/Sxy family protein [Advenella mimigardefordensis]|uniref:Tfox domain-containing protein n=1 Tax=Advenella mimigardefordensis (strain DSM 17166 / LMG 22922 / DPN7) TaxID=1247726 RepID=W0PE20_ADVMD|nr:TfoX/Sxy family protein [Advenella mimigardefordensis]AHG65129.1 Tfox domain-containing protein [Advenella mimigardefordensis DPN7]
MSVSRDFLEYVLDLLAPLGPVTTRRMFGSVGLYLDGRMFAIVSGEERFYVKRDDQTQEQFELAGCLPLTYARKEPDGTTKTIELSFYAPPESILDDRQQILKWAQLGVEAAARAPEKRKRKPSGGSPAASYRRRK